MPNNDVAAQVVRKVNRMRTELERSKRVALTAAAVVVKREVEHSRDRLVGGDKLRNVRGRGGQLKVRYDVVPGDEAVVVKALGAWPLVEMPVKAHKIGVRGDRTATGRKRRGGGSGKKALAFNGVVVASVEHPGIKNPKKPFQKGVEAGRPKAVRELRDATTNAVRRGLKA